MEEISFGVSVAYSRQEPGSIKQVSGVGAGFCSRNIFCDLRIGTKEGSITPKCAYPLRTW